MGLYLGSKPVSQMSVFDLIEEVVSFGIVVAHTGFVCIEEILVREVFDQNQTIMRSPHMRRRVPLGVMGLHLN